MVLRGQGLHRAAVLRHLLLRHVHARLRRPRRPPPGRQRCWTRCSPSSSDPATPARGGDPDRYVGCGHRPALTTGPSVAPSGSWCGSSSAPRSGCCSRGSAARRSPTPAQVDATSPAAAPPSSTGSRPGQFADLTDDQALTRRGVRAAHRRAAAGRHRRRRRPGQPALRPDHPPDPAARREETTPARHHLPGLGGHRRARARARRRHRTRHPLIGVPRRAGSSPTPPAADARGLTGAQARQLATLAAGRGPVATPAPDRLPPWPSKTMADPAQTLTFLSWVRERVGGLVTGAERRAGAGGPLGHADRVGGRRHRSTGHRPGRCRSCSPARRTWPGPAARRDRAPLPGARHARPRVGPLPLRRAGRPGAARGATRRPRPPRHAAPTCTRGWCWSWARRAPS